MKKTLLLIYVITSSLLSSSFAPAQSPTKTESNQMRPVKRQVLTSAYLPSIRVKFDKRFKYVGSQKFILYGRAQVEQHFFVDADKQRRIKGMYMVQFEGYLPNVNATYDYAATKTVNLGGQTYIANAESIPNVSAALKQDPLSDVARAASFLESKGFRISESIIFQRFVRLVDGAKRNEFILLYVEDTDTVASAENEKASQEFSSRALKGFTILK
jgi:excinuclease UvrABC ATPase subunit